jgi:hypothetical protein
MCNVDKMTITTSSNMKVQNVDFVRNETYHTKIGTKNNDVTGVQQSARGLTWNYKQGNPVRT